jgi:hypothetical protein
MSTASSHEMSSVSHLNLEMYAEVGHDLWWRAYNLFVNVRSLYESPKKTPNSSRNVSKSFKKGDWNSRKGANHAKDVFDNKVSMSPTWVWSFE